MLTFTCGGSPTTCTISFATSAGCSAVTVSSHFRQRALVAHVRRVRGELAFDQSGRDHRDAHPVRDEFLAQRLAEDVDPNLRR